VRPQCPHRRTQEGLGPPVIHEPRRPPGEPPPAGELPPHRHGGDFQPFPAVLRGPAAVEHVAQRDALHVLPPEHRHRRAQVRFPLLHEAEEPVAERGRAHAAAPRRVHGRGAAFEGGGGRREVPPAVDDGGHEGGEGAHLLQLRGGSGRGITDGGEVN